MSGARVLASPRSALIRRKLQHLRGHRFGGRAARFKVRLAAAGGRAHKLLDFATVAALPDWVLADDSQQAIIGLGAAILDERGAIDRELSGERLVAIAGLVGDEMFEALCDCPLPDGVLPKLMGRLPRPEDFAVIGANLRRWAMPTALRDEIIGDADAKRARLLCDLAAAVADKTGYRA
jgi:hypothetical protein